MIKLPNETANTEDFEFEALDAAVNYRRALIGECTPFLKGRIIEIGAGIGQMTVLLSRISAVKRVLSIEPEDTFYLKLRDVHGKDDTIHGTIKDVKEADWDGIVSVNVLEHIEDDVTELVHYANLLNKNRGSLCLFVPARRELYAPIDKDFGHFRRYTKKELSSKLRRAGFEIIKMRYYNSAGYFAWLFTFKLLKNRRFNRSAVKFYDNVIFPVINLLERKVVPPPIGQSLLVIARSSTGTATNLG